MITYLATPYSHPDPDVQKARFEVVSRVAGELMRHGEIIFSPISHAHPIACQCELPKDWQFWEQFDLVYLRLAKKLIVLMQDGWDKSVGVAAEIRMARELDIPIEYIKP